MTPIKTGVTQRGSKGLQQNLKIRQETLNILQSYIKETSREFNDTSKILQRNFKDTSKTRQRYFKDTSRDFKDTSKRDFKRLQLKRFQRDFTETSKKLHRDFKDTS